ncbi:MAG TPA: peptidylprolyl isomerase [Devosiaceae bacterium]|nr:peptidylprolyl isomerase [Devosiaceae bacterium]
MLDRMRSFATTWPARILIGLLIAGLSVFGISNVFTNLGSDTVGNVGSQEISTRDFQRAYLAQVDSYASQAGFVPTVEEAISLGIPSQVLQQLAATAALDGLAGDFGLGASEAQVAEAISQDPNLRGLMGGFDRQRFTDALRQSGWTEAEYLDSQSRAVSRRQLGVALFDGLTAPRTMFEIAERYQSDKRTIEYFSVNFTAIDAIADPTDAELQAYLDANQANYVTTETRSIRALVLTPEVYARTLDIDEADLAAEYQRTAAQYFEPATRTVRVLALPAAATVTWFKLGLSNNKSFDTLLEETGLGEAVVDLGTVTREQIADPAVAETAFALDAGEYGLAGESAVFVTAADPGGQQPFEAVRDQVHDQLGIARARDAMADIIDQIEERRAALSPIGDIAASFGLAATDATTDPAGDGLEALADLPAEARATLASAAFAADPDRLIPSIPLSANSTIWFDVTGSDPARSLTLEEAREQLVADWTADKTETALRARADELAARIQTGELHADVAIEIGGIPQVSAPIGRDGDSLSIGPNVARQAFAGGVGHVGAARNGDGEYMVFVVTDVQPAAIADAQEDWLPTFGQAIAQSVYSQFIVGLQADAGLRINQQVLQDLLTNTLGTQ